MRKLILMACLLLSTTVYSQGKPVIAVGEITSAVGGFNTLSIQLALENALQKTNKYTMMERRGWMMRPVLQRGWMMRPVMQRRGWMMRPVMQRGWMM